MANKIKCDIYRNHEGTGTYEFYAMEAGGYIFYAHNKTVLQKIADVLESGSRKGSRAELLDWAQAQCDKAKAKRQREKRQVRQARQQSRVTSQAVPYPAAKQQQEIVTGILGLNPETIALAQALLDNDAQEAARLLAGGKPRPKRRGK